MASEPIVGIDLGTSYSSVACVVDGKVIVVPDEQGRTAQPSIVSFPKEGGVLVGFPARARLVTDPTHTVYSVKRLIGRRFDDPAVRAIGMSLPYQLAEGPNRSVVVQVRDQQYAIPEISAYVLRSMRRVAERALGRRVEKAVITVPANFNDAQREATRICGRIAGLDVARILNEPTAAALARGYGRGADRMLAVYDFGGGTFDFTVLEVRERVFRVINTAGDMMLGGDDFDHALATRVHDFFWRQTGVELRRDMVEWQRLLLAAEACKRELSRVSESEIRVPRVAHTPRGPLDLHVKVTRDQFNSLCLDLVKRTFAVCDRALGEAGVGVENIDDVLMVGGTTHVPLVRSAAEQHFRRSPRSDVDPETAVAVGAAIHAATLMGEEAPADKALLLDVLPHSIGIAAAGGFSEKIIERAAALPVEATRVFATSRDGQTEVRIVVVQGESRHTRENTLLGELVIDGLRPATRGEIEIEVTFEVDQSGILSVSARDRDSGRVLRKRMRLSGDLPEDEIRAARERLLTGDSHAARNPSGRRA